MTKEQLKSRFKVFALDVVQFAHQLPERPKAYGIIEGQVIRSSTSAASNYRAACRGRSIPDFIAKLGIVEEELDETQFWLEFTVGISSEWRSKVAPLWREADELLSITVSSIKTARTNQQLNKKK